MTRICDVMHKGVIFCYNNDSVREVAKIMDENQIRGVVVIDDSGDVWGLISNTDLLQYYYDDIDTLKAEDIMKPYKIDVDPLWPIEKAIEIMKRNKFEHLIIIDPNAGPKRPVAILTTYDIVQYMSSLNMGKYEQILKQQGGE
jgi:CBS domain-containing protein